MSQDGASNVLLTCLYQSIWLNTVIAQWLKPQIWSLNLSGAFLFFLHFNIRNLATVLSQGCRKGKGHKQ